MIKSVTTCRLFILLIAFIIALSLGCSSSDVPPDSEPSKGAANNNAAAIEPSPAQTPDYPPGPAAQPAPSPLANPVEPKQRQKAQRGPSLIVPVRRIDFGKRPQNVSLSRSITIKNGGNAALNVFSVEPS